LNSGAGQQKYRSKKIDVEILPGIHRMRKDTPKSPKENQKKNQEIGLAVFSGETQEKGNE